MLYDFGVPGDSVKLRKRIFKELMTPDSETGYMDGEDYGLMRPFIESQNLDWESRLWLAFIYGTSYSCTTTIRFVTEFESIKKATSKKLESFWDSQKDTLWYQPDKRYLKNNNQVVPAIRCMRELSHGSMVDYLVPLLEKGFDTTYKEIIKNWRFFGPSGAYLFFDAIYAYLPELYSEPSELDWKNCGQTVPEGMAQLLGLDEQALHEEPYDIKRYNRAVESMVDKKGWNKNVIESNLCFLRKLYKGTRYLGYYADRQLEECTATANYLKKFCGVDIWKLRELTTPESMRGETGGWSGIRKDRYKIFLNTGALV